ncbi:MAG: hypothetical protein K9J16_07645 [Melioribacteraceae bacterium]|nr:hypothetical protein [Melioribacteraceae bacterium]MCF8357029.1 hypothetical protein [Melioribacteraceae bacterium]MCF8393955.1 hypothetical protein [Melioribacteraceae bacterium]MCF8419028.1 hypothetical protein [Melioribacteraceae bacterium]
MVVFTQLIPPICQVGLRTLDYRLKKIISYDQEYKIVSNAELPKELYYMPYRAVKVNDFYFFFASKPEDISTVDYYIRNKSIIKINNDFKTVNSLLKWDEIYLDENNLAYSISNFRVHLRKINEKTILALQSGSYFLHLISTDTGKIKSFGSKPKFFKKIPKNIDPKSVQANAESVAEFASQTSVYLDIFYDSVNQFYISHYVNLSKNYFRERSLLLGKHYIQVYNNNYNCIYDGEVDGIPQYTYQGKLYVLSEENPDYFKILVCQLGDKK